MTWLEERKSTPVYDGAYTPQQRPEVLPNALSAVYGLKPVLLGAAGAVRPLDDNEVV